MKNPHLNSHASSCIIGKRLLAGVMELVDVTDSKSVGSDTVWVRVPPPAPRRSKRHIACSGFFCEGQGDSAALPLQPATASAGFGGACRSDMAVIHTVVMVQGACFPAFERLEEHAPFFIRRLRQGIVAWHTFSGIDAATWKTSTGAALALPSENARPPPAAQAKDIRQTCTVRLHRSRGENPRGKDVRPSHGGSSVRLRFYWRILVPFFLRSVPIPGILTPGYRCRPGPDRDPGPAV